MIYVLILLINLFNCAGQMCQKYATFNLEGINSLWHRVCWMTISLLLLGIAMILWLWVLRLVPVGIAYPILSFNLVLITLIDRWFWQEKISLCHGCGLILIILGIIFMGINL